MDISVEEFLEHHGVKGMRWGVRGTRRVQKRVDRLDRISKGRGTKGDRFKAAAVQGVYTKKGAGRILQRGANYQAKVKVGKHRVSNALVTLQGVKVKDVNYRRKGNAKAGMDNHQKAALAVLATVGAINLATVLANN